MRRRKEYGETHKLLVVVDVESLSLSHRRRSRKEFQVMHESWWGQMLSFRSTSISFTLVSSSLRYPIVLSFVNISKFLRGQLQSVSVWSLLVTDHPLSILSCGRGNFSFFKRLLYMKRNHDFSWWLSWGALSWDELSIWDFTLVDFPEDMTQSKGTMAWRENTRLISASPSLLPWMKSARRDHRVR